MGTDVTWNQTKHLPQDQSSIKTDLPADRKVDISDSPYLDGDLKYPPAFLEDRLTKYRAIDSAYANSKVNYAAVKVRTCLSSDSMGETDLRTFKRQEGLELASLYCHDILDNIGCDEITRQISLGNGTSILFDEGGPQKGLVWGKTSVQLALIELRDTIPCRSRPACPPS